MYNVQPLTSPKQR